MLIESFKVASDAVEYHEDHISAQYSYDTTGVSQQDGKWTVRPRKVQYTFRTSTRVPKLG